MREKPLCYPCSFENFLRFQQQDKHNASYFFKMLWTDRCQSNYKVKHFFSMPGVSEPQIFGKSIEQNEIK